MILLKDIRYPAKGRSAPQVAIIIPCYNDGAFIVDAIQSCLRWEFTDWEMQIVDDGSTDTETLALLDQLRENGFPVIRQENKGLAAARNTGIKATTAPFIIPLDADNKLEDSLGAIGIPFLQAHPETDVFYTDYVCFGESDEIRNPGPPDLARLLTGNYIDALGLFRRSYWQSVGGYDENIPGNFYEDWEFWLHGMSLGRKFHYEPVVGFAYRVKPVSLVSKALIPESRMAAVRYIGTKHKTTYATGFIDAFVNLHGALAAWEGSGGKARQVLEAEFQQHRKVMEDAFAAETEKLHKHYEVERGKVSLHYFREREKSEAHLYAQREEWEQAFRARENTRIRELETLLENKDTEHQAELASRLLIREEERESEKRNWEKKQIELNTAYQAQETHLNRVYEQRLREMEEHFTQEKIRLSSFYLQHTEQLDEKEKQIQTALHMQRQYAEQLQRLIAGYEQQVHDMENTFTWKLRKNYYKVRNIFKGGKGKRKRIPGLGFIKRVFFFFTGKGRLIIRRFFKKIFRQTRPLFTVAIPCMRNGWPAIFHGKRNLRNTNDGAESLRTSRW